MRYQKKAAVLLLAVGLALGCAANHLKLAVDAEKVGQSALIATRIADQNLYDQGLITKDQHTAHQAALFNAFDLHEQAVKLTLLAADGKPTTPGEYAAKVQQAWLILQAVIADFPKSPAKDKATAAVARGIF